jgi:hypothetical protein
VDSRHMFQRNREMGIMKKVSWAVVAMLSLSAAASAQTTYTIAEVGGDGCAATGINDYSDVAGQCNGVATVWQNGVEISLGRLPKGTYSAAQSSNAAGVAVGNSDDGDGRPLAVMYRNGAVINIDSGANNAYGIRINDSGVIAGNFLKGFGGCDNWTAAVWTEDPKKPGRFRRTDLQPYPSGDAAARCENATAANAGIQVVGWVQSSVFGQMGAFWDNDATHTLSLLQPYPGDWTSIALGVNDLGQAVGESHPPFGSRPVVWGNDGARTPVALPLLPGDNYGVATAINNHGDILGWSAYAVPDTWNVSPSRPVVWRAGGVFELTSVLDPATGSGWTITAIFAINNLGQIVGIGSHNGQQRTFVMTPLVP